MRSIVSRFAFVAALAVAAIATPATAHASDLADGGNGAGLVRVSPAAPANTLTHKQQVADAKAAWKAVKALQTQPDLPAAQPFRLRVEDGTLSVDGVAAKTNLNYTVDCATYLSFYLPGTGLITLSSNAVTGATPVKAAISGNMLAFNVAGHDIRLVSHSNISGDAPVDAYVRIDTSDDAKRMGNYILMGYGVLLQAPYTSSGSVAMASAK